MAEGCRHKGAKAQRDRGEKGAKKDKIKDMSHAESPR